MDPERLKLFRLKWRIIMRLDAGYFKARRHIQHTLRNRVQDMVVVLGMLDKHWRYYECLLHSIESAENSQDIYQEFTRKMSNSLGTLYRICSILPSRDMLRICRILKNVPYQSYGVPHFGALTELFRHIFFVPE